ncbi:hypothetical protein VHUM_03210 [Vanrija humicola]|uniref:Metallo-beta-lactamase domain-containing protein n=1 Tax=Vanrija humicola TaxID=5417 RepID=A0A7D8V0F1_VANHU|nr:hypothetical protein VHUM_03210 [Vanrija humicola]
MPKEFYIREELTALSAIPQRALDALADDSSLPVCATCATQYPAPRRDCTHAKLSGSTDHPQARGATTSSATSRTRASRSSRPSRSSPSLRRVSISPACVKLTPAFLLETFEGSFIWDCSAVLTPPLIAHLTHLRRPLKAMAISHPHFFSTSLTWARALGVPLYINALDKEWYQRRESAGADEVVFWSGTQRLSSTLTLIECGGHFPGSCVLHWDRAAEPLTSDADARAPDTGLLLVADTVMVQPTQKGITFMWSIPNAIPLHPTDVLHIQNVLREYDYDSVSSTWPDRWVRAGAARIFDESVETYLSATGWERGRGDELVPRRKK